MNVTAERIRELRIENHLTQLELAQRADLERKAISRYESGLNIPGGRALAKLAEIFGVSADYLLGLVDDRGPASMSDLSPLEREAVLALRLARSDDQRRRLLDALKRASASVDKP